MIRGWPSTEGDCYSAKAIYKQSIMFCQRWLYCIGIARYIFQLARLLHCLYTCARATLQADNETRQIPGVENDRQVNTLSRHIGST